MCTILLIRVPGVRLIWFRFIHFVSFVIGEWGTGCKTAKSASQSVSQSVRMRIFVVKQKQTVFV